MVSFRLETHMHFSEPKPDMHSKGNIKEERILLSMDTLEKLYVCFQP